LERCGSYHAKKKEDIRQFFKDWGATAERTVRRIRSFTENYYNSIGEMLKPIPWFANFTKKLHGYVEQDFDAATTFVKDVSQAADIQEFTWIYIAYIQQCVELFAAQARDFAEAYLDVPRNTKARSH
jgi:hypothetical protein